MTRSEEALAPATFDVLPLSKEIRDGVDGLGFAQPTPVQVAVYEPATQGRSLVVQARTGTGKTVAFGLPILDRLIRYDDVRPQGLVLTPTRELAIQVAKELVSLGKFRGAKIATIYGGASMEKQIQELAGGVHLVVGTPGRVLDHLRRGTLDPSKIRIFVLDEADEMLSMGFAKELQAIVQTLPKERQGLFFSATVPPDIENMARRQMREPEFITLSSDQVGALEISHIVYLVQADKKAALVRVLEVENPESAVIFCNTKDETERVAQALQNQGYEADYLSGDLDQKERERVMSRTREGKLRFLVATDVAARGIDISHLTHVINYDFPESAEYYIHRTGRTGRAGRTGTAVSLVAPKDIGSLYLVRLVYKIRPIEKLLPSERDLQTRSELDLVDTFRDQFLALGQADADRALARRIMTHDRAEEIVAGLLRAHLGAQEAVGTDPKREGAEARRGKNPPPVITETRERDTIAEEVRPKREPAPPSPAKRESRRERRPEARRRDEHGEGAVLRSAPDRDPMESMHEPKTDLRPRPPEMDPGARVFLNVGKKEGIRPADVLGWLEEAGIPRERVGSIRIRDSMTFVGLAPELLEQAVTALNGRRVRERTLVAEPARAQN